jgi:hypothetical protein
MLAVPIWGMGSIPSYNIVYFVPDDRATDLYKMLMEYMEYKNFS